MRHDVVPLLLLLILLSTMLLSKLFPVGALSVCFWAEAFSIITNMLHACGMERPQALRRSWCWHESPWRLGSTIAMEALLLRFPVLVWRESKKTISIENTGKAWIFRVL
jgi:hypothetical protein